MKQNWDVQLYVGGGVTGIASIVVHAYLCGERLWHLRSSCIRSSQRMRCPGACFVYPAPIVGDLLLVRGLVRRYKCRRPLIEGRPQDD